MPKWVSPLFCVCLDFRNLLFHLRNQHLELFLALLPRGSVDILGDSFSVHAWGEPVLVEVVVYHRHATRTGLAYLAADRLVRLKFRLCRLIVRFTVTCLVRCVRLVALIGERPEKFIGVTEQHPIVAADRDPSFSQPFLKILKGRLKELADALAGEPDGIEKLIVGVRHHAVHKRGIVVSLDNTEDRAVLAFVERIEKAFALLLEGHILWHEFEVLHAALGDDQLDVLDIARRGIARKPAYLCDVVIKEPILQVGVECTGLEETIAQEHHAVRAVSVFAKYLGIQQSLAVPDDVFDLGFFLLCHKVVRVGFLDAYHIFGKAADSVANDEDRFLGKPDCALDAAERESDIRLLGSLIGGSVSRKVAGAPRHHVRIQRFCNKKATTVAACSRASLVADIVDAVNIESVGV